MRRKHIAHHELECVRQQLAEALSAVFPASGEVDSHHLYNAHVSACIAVSELARLHTQFDKSHLPLTVPTRLAPLFPISDHNPHIHAQGGA